MNVTLVHADPAAEAAAANGTSVTPPSNAPSTELCETSRFGRLRVLTDSIVDFPDGLIGIGGTRYALISTDTKSPFLWLQSLEQPALALPVTNPHKFFSDFQVKLDDDDASASGLDDGHAADVYVTVTASPVLSEFTANLRAPIVIRDGKGHQLINQMRDCQVKARLFASTNTPRP